MNTIATEIINKCCKQYLPNCGVLLFGSRVRNDYTEDSDYDFIVITETELSVEKNREYRHEIRKSLAKNKLAADVLIYSQKEIETKKEIIGHIVRQAIKEGVRI